MSRDTLMDQALRLYRQTHFREAAEIYQGLAKAEPNVAEHRLNIGRCLMQARDFDTAQSHLERAAAMNPNDLKGLFDLSNCLLMTGEIREAERVRLLSCGDGDNQMPQHRTFMGATILPEGVRDLPIWRGQELSGKRLAVVANQGIGDTIDWARYLETLAAQGCTIVLQCQETLVELFRQCRIADEILPPDAPFPPCDFVAPMSGLGYRLGKVDWPAEPSAIPYLEADPTLVEHWRSEILSDAYLNVGLVWSGNPNHPRDSERSIPSVFLEPLLAVSGVQFYCLQTEISANDPLLHDPRCIVLDDEIIGFHRAAAAIGALDLVITVDTSLVHLAGALGAPTWALLVHRPDFRWLGSADEPPHYQTVDAYRQINANDWLPLIAARAADLDALVAAYFSGKTKSNTPKSADASPLLENGPIRTKRCRHGVVSYLAGDTYVGGSFDRYGEFCEDEIALFRQVVRPGQTVLDIGANIGAHTLFFGHAVGRRGRVYAFEPQRIIHGLLCTNVALNDMTNIYPMHAAVGRENGTISVPHIDYGVSGNFGGLSLAERPAGEGVPLVTIDGLGLAACHFIKIDVEGMEYEVLEGAKQTIGRYRPYLYAENNRRDKSPALIKALLDLGYRLYWHLAPYYNDANFFGNRNNVFGRTVACNLFCLSRQTQQKISGMQEVSSPEEWILPL